MKAKFLFNVLLTAFVVIFISSCKKDITAGLEGKSYYYYCEKSEDRDPIMGCGKSVHFYSNNKAGILPGGDIMESATYSVKGKIITVTINDSRNYQAKFETISNTQLKEISTGYIWTASTE